MSEIRAYFRGIDAALSQLEKRLAARRIVDRSVVLSELERYHRVIRENIAMLEGGEAEPQPRS